MRPDFDPLYLRALRAALCPAHHGIHVSGIALHCGFHRAVAAVVHPARDSQILSFAAHRFAEVNALYAAINHKVKRFFKCNLVGHSIVYLRKYAS